MGLYNVLDRGLLQGGQPEDISKVLGNLDAIAAILNGGIDDTNFAGGLIFGLDKIKQNAATIGQVPAWDGAKWAPSDARYPIAPTMVGPALTPTTNGALTANAAYLTPIALTCPTTISRIVCLITASGGTGNIDVGIYFSDDDVTFTRLVSKGSTATPANGVASVTFAPTVMTPVVGRRWYLALSVNNATVLFATNTLPTPVLANAFSKTVSFPLPASLTGMTSPANPQPYVYGLI